MDYKEAGFRGQFIGGFRRKDVVDYIENLAAERNALAAENERLREDLAKLEEKEFIFSLPDILESEDDDSSDKEDDTHGDAEKVERANAEAAAAIQEAEALLGELEHRYDIICADVDVCASHMRCEMESASERLEGLKTALKSTGERIGELRASLGANRTEE